MKSILFLLSLIILTSCSRNDIIKSNPYIPNYSFNTGILINTNLPEYSQLKFSGNHVILNNYGFKGVVLYYVGGEQYTAFELTDPNHIPSSCSKLNVEGVIATCGCDDGNSYDILTGSMREGTTGGYTLKPYRVEVSGNIIRVSNN
ncbi:hypothetical protein [Thalassobellus suaedae]|uniref:Rieske domain-containing protein n=1 Tax=Thalassobellus suaedae TaxID=3074124 RepID=A0ABY9XRE9_9FLAO|nr:hypothetical protein RHP51_14715 [Flavobacteriaceae bacterium HL-DH14]WNH13712.1 hypothetical protein RHP49_05515 [Flavobacteriaceae bacterium HL-DH10]